MTSYLTLDQGYGFVIPGDETEFDWDAVATRAGIDWSWVESDTYELVDSVMELFPDLEHIWFGVHDCTYGWLVVIKTTHTIGYEGEITVGNGVGQLDLTSLSKCFKLFFPDNDVDVNWKVVGSYG